MHQHEKINYVEFPSTDFDATKDFFNSVFGWEFTDYGENYTAFSDQGLDGGFFKSTKCSYTKNGTALVVFYSNALEETEKKIEASTGKITQEIFSRPAQVSVWRRSAHWF